MFKYENDGQGKKIEAGEKGTEYDDFIALLGGTCLRECMWA